MYAEFGIPVIWIEAIPEVYEQLKINLKDYPNQDSVLACLSDEEDKEVTFHVSNNEAQSSSFLELGTHKESHPTVSYLYDFATKTKTLKSVISETGVDVTDWLLVGDLQGAEGLMLKEQEICLINFLDATLRLIPIMFTKIASLNQR